MLVAPLFALESINTKKDKGMNMLIVGQKKEPKTSIIFFYFWLIGSFNNEINASESWPDNEQVLEYIFFIKIAEKFHIPDLCVEEHCCWIQKQINKRYHRKIYVGYNRLWWDACIMRRLLYKIGRQKHCK